MKMKNGLFRWLLPVLLLSGWTQTTHADWQWKSVGHRWAIRIDSKTQEVDSLYDLSYPRLFERVTLGRVENSKSKLSTIRKLYREAKQASEGMSVNSQSKVQMLSQEDEDRFFEQAEKIGENWWRELPWKSSVARINSIVPPASFRLSDLETEQDLERAQGILGDLPKVQGIPETIRRFFESFEFKRVSESPVAYEIVWAPSAQEVASMNESARGLLSGPQQLVNIRDPEVQLREALADVAFYEGLSFAIDSFVAAPVLNALLSTAVHRYFKYRHNLHKLHNAFAFEAMSMAVHDGDTQSAFAFLTAEQRNQAIKGMFYGQTSLSRAIYWLVVPPLKYWDKKRKTAVESSAASLQWIENHDGAAEMLSDRFARVTYPDGNTRLEILARATPSKKRGAFAALDEKDLDYRVRQRTIINGSSLTVDFVSRLVPLVGMVLRKGFEYFVERPVATDIEWEARLETALHEDAIQNGSDWKREVDLIFAQRFNPFALSRGQTFRLIGDRKAELGIQ